MNITKGLKFTSTTFHMMAEISAVRESKNEVDVILTPSNGNAWEEKNWNLEHTKSAFEKQVYKEVERRKDDGFGFY